MYRKTGVSIKAKEPLYIDRRIQDKYELNSSHKRDILIFGRQSLMKRKSADLQEQPGRSLTKNLKAWPTSCDVGTQKSAKDDKESGVGYKLHLDGSDGDIPISGILTSASLHDSQTAIPLAQMSAERVTSLYDLMDAPYDAPEIHAYSKRRGHVPIIDQTPRRGEKKQMDPPEKSRD